MDAIVLIDAAGTVLHWNPAAQSLFGYSPEETLGAELAALIIPEELRDAHRNALARAARGPGRALGRRMEVRGNRADGSSFPVELTISRLDHLGTAYFVGYLRDITDRVGLMAELRASRTRLITASDQARRRVERDLHDGAQQQLVALAMTLASMRSALPADVPGALTLAERAGDEVTAAIRGLREIAHGLHPSVLTDRGLRAAVAELVRRSGIPVTVDAVPDTQLADEVQIALYYFVSEALTNAAKHGAASARITSHTTTQHVLGGPSRRLLVLTVTDDGPGGADLGAGSGLRGLRDRLGAVDGELDIYSAAGAGTTLTARVATGSAPTH